MIDLRSDTVTKPTDQMRDAMKLAKVGDDVYQEDTTICQLESRVAAMFCKESALFFPSGTMSNLVAALTWCSTRGSEMIVGDNSHMFLFEQAGVAQFGGISPRTVPNLPDGTMNIELVKSAIREDDIHEPITKLICIENTHNVCGGKVLPLEFMLGLRNLADKKSIPIHMDGARIWNALTAMDVKPHEIGCYVDSLSVCLSKGLGAPVGSLLVGSAEFIDKARRLRKALGGGMRQSGILAAAGLVALDDFEAGILKKDHKRTALLADTVQEEEIKSFRLYSTVETNILFIDILLWNPTWNPEKISSIIRYMFSERGIRVSAWAPRLLRMVLHRDIDDTDIKHIVTALREINHILHVGIPHKL